MIAAGIGMWALGVGTYLLRTLPRRGISFIYKHATTRLTLISSHVIYHDFLVWYEDHNYSHNSRTIKISNGRHGWDQAVKAMGYGVHYFMHGWTPIRLVVTQKEAQASERERDEIHMTVLGRSHRVFDKIFDEIRKKKQRKNDKIDILRYAKEWERSSAQRKRPLDSVCLNKGVKEKLVNFIDKFRENEEFHLRHGISHQTAIMLHGPPGTGKTSVIKALASHYEMPIYNLSPSALSNITSAFSRLPENALVVIEDIDTNASLHLRAAEQESVFANKDGDGDPTTNAMPKVSTLDELFTNFSDVLNAIDGVTVSHGRILIATTNYVDKLDPALLRPGRFDLKVEIGYADNYAIRQFFERFFEGRSFPEGYQIRDGVTPAELQHAAIENIDDPDSFLDKFSCHISARATARRSWACV